MDKIISCLFYIKTLFLKCIRIFFTYINGGEKCIICGNNCFKYPVCKKCTKTYFKVDENTFSNRCKKCGRDLISTENLCTSCKEKSIIKSIDRMIPIFSYRLWYKELLYIWKIQGVRNLSYFFSDIIYKTLKIMNYQIIVPVPPRKGKIKKNGWDQIDELTNILEKLKGITRLKLLKRVSQEEQKKLNREERLETIKTAYEIVNEKLFHRELKKIGGKLPKSV